MKYDQLLKRLLEFKGGEHLPSIEAIDLQAVNPVCQLLNQYQHVWIKTELFSQKLLLKPVEQRRV